MLLVTGLAVALAGPAGAVGAAPAPVGERGPSPSPAARALAEKIDLDFEKTSLDNVVKYLNEIRPALGLVVGGEVKAAGIDLSSRVVSLRVKQAPLEPLLYLLLEPDMDLRVEPERVLVTTREKGRRRVVTEAYPVGDILTRACKMEGARVMLLYAVGEIVTGPDVLPWWVPHSRPSASIALRGTDMVVTQTVRGHERVADVLARLRTGWAAQDAAGAAGAKAPAAAPEPQETAAVRRALAEKVDLDFEKTGLDNVLKYLSEVVKGLNLVVEPISAPMGRDLSSPFTRAVDLCAKRISVGAALDIVLGPDLEYRVERGYCLVTERGRLWQELPLEVYPVADIEACGDPAPSPGNTAEHADLISRLVDPSADPLLAAWMHEGGQAMITYLPGVLIVTQTPRGHERVAEALACLRRVLAARGSAGLAGAEGAAAAVENPESAERAAARRRLDDLVDLDFDVNSIDNILKYINEVKRGMNLVVGPEVSAAGIDLVARPFVDLKVRRIPVAFVLDIVLGPELGWRAEPGYIRVTSREWLQHDLALEVHPAEDLVQSSLRYHEWTEFKMPSYDWDPRQFVWQELTALIQRSVNRESAPAVAAWQDEGGAAVVEPVGNALLVRQTPEGQAALAAMLARARQAFAARDACPGRGARPAPVQPVVEWAGPEDVHEAATRKRLQEKVSVRFRDLALDEAIEAINRAQPGLNAVFDDARRAVLADSKRKVTLEVAGETAASVLARVLGTDLAAVPQRGWVRITAAREARREVARAYPVADLLPAPPWRGRAKDVPPEPAEGRKWLNEACSQVEENKLIDAMRKAVNRGSDEAVSAWHDEGGPGQCESLWGVLIIISQTPEGHQKVLEYFHRLRRERLKGTE